MWVVSAPCKIANESQSAVQLQNGPILAFLWVGNTFLYLIWFVHLFFIQLFSPSEIIFTDGEQV